MYIAHIRQQGEGCDYTIGCAQRTITLKARTQEGALKELRRDYGDRDDLEFIRLYEVSQCIEVDLEAWSAENEEAERKANAEATEKAEREQLARLKAKYGA